MEEGRPDMGSGRFDIGHGDWGREACGRATNPKESRGVCGREPRQEGGGCGRELRQEGGRGGGVPVAWRCGGGRELRHGGGGCGVEERGCGMEEGMEEGAAAWRAADMRAVDKGAAVWRRCGGGRELQRGGGGYGVEEGKEGGCGVEVCGGGCAGGVEAWRRAGAAAWRRWLRRGGGGCGSDSRRVTDVQERGGEREEGRGSPRPFWRQSWSQRRRGKMMKGSRQDSWRQAGFGKIVWEDYLGIWDLRFWKIIWVLKEDYYGSGEED